MHTAFEKVSNCLIICHIASFVADIKKVFRLFGFVNVRIWSTAATFRAENLAASLAIITPVTLAKREKPIVGRNPIQFLKSNRSLQMVPGFVLAWSKLIYRLKLVRICSSLQDKMCSTLCPPHLLSLQQSFDATVITDQSTGRSRAFGFVTLNNAADPRSNPYEYH